MIFPKAHLTSHSRMSDLSVSSIQFSHSVVSNSLQPYESQHARPPCPSPTPGVHSNSCPSSQWCHPAISSSVIPFSHPQSLPASGSFLMSQFFASGGQSIGVSASASVLVRVKEAKMYFWPMIGWLHEGRDQVCLFPHVMLSSFSVLNPAGLCCY